MMKVGKETMIQASRLFVVNPNLGRPTAPVHNRPNMVVVSCDQANLKHRSTRLYAVQVGSYTEKQL